MDDLIIACSTRRDGTMLDRSLADRHAHEVVANRQAFCEKNAIDYERCIYQVIAYGDTQTYDVLRAVSAPNPRGVHADVLYTETPGLGLFLPVADCIGTVIYDPQRKALALAHIGRHASVAKTMTKTIEFFKEKGSDPADLKVWMAPSISKENYVMQHFDHVDDPDWKDFAIQMSDGIHLDLQGFTAKLAVSAGVKAANIEISPINTATSSEYFSHSQGDTNGRFAVIAMMK